MPKRLLPRLLSAAAAALLLATQSTANTGECENGYNLGAIFFSDHSIADSDLDSFTTSVKGAIAKVLKGKVSIRANCVPAANYGQSVHVRLWTTAPPSADTFLYDMAAAYIKSAVDGGDLRIPGLAASQIHWDPDGVTITTTATTTATSLAPTTKTPCQGFNVGAIVFNDYNRDTYLSGAQEATFSKRVLDKAKIYLLTASPKVETGIKCSFVTYGAFDSKDGKGMRINLVLDAADDVNQATQQEFSNVRRVLIDKIGKGSFFVLRVDEDEPARANAYDGDVVDYDTTTATTTQSSSATTSPTTTGTSAYGAKFVSVPAGDNVVYLGVSDGVNCRPQTNGLSYLLGTCKKPYGVIGCDVMAGAAADGGDLQLIADRGGSASCQKTADAISDLIRELTGPLNSLNLKMKCTSFKYLYMEANDEDGETATNALAAAVEAYFAGEIHGCEITTVTSTGTSTASSTATTTGSTYSSSPTSSATSSLTTTMTSSATSSFSTTATTSASSTASTSASTTATSTRSNTGTTSFTTTATTTASGTAQSTLTSTVTSSLTSSASTTVSTTATTTGSTTSSVTTTTKTTTTSTTITITTTSITTTTTTTVTTSTTSTITTSTITTSTITTITTTTTPTTTPMFGYCEGEEDPATCFIEFKESACEGALKEFVRELCPAMCDSCVTTTATSTETSTATTTATTTTTSTTTISTTTSTSSTTTTTATTSTTTTTTITSTRTTTTTHTATTETTTTTLTETTTTTTTTRTADPCLAAVSLGAIAFAVYDRDSLADSDEREFARSVLVEANWQLSRAGYTTRITCTEVSYGSIIVNLGASPNTGTTANHVQAALMLEGMVKAGTFEVPLVASRTETTKPELWSRVNSDLVDDMYVVPIGTTTVAPAYGVESVTNDEPMLEPLPTGWIIVAVMLVCVAILGFFIAGLVYKRKQQSPAGMVSPNANGSVAVYSQGAMQRAVTAQDHEHPDYHKGIITSSGQQRSTTPFPRPLSFVGSNYSSSNNNGPQTLTSHRALPQIPTTNHGVLPQGVSLFGAPSPPMSPTSLGSSPQSPMGIDGGMDFFQESLYNGVADDPAAGNAASQLHTSHLSIGGLSQYAIATEPTLAVSSPLPHRLPRHAEESNLDHSVSNMQTMLGQLMRDDDVDSSYMDMDGEMESVDEFADPGNHFYPKGPGSVLPMTML